MKDKKNLFQLAAQKAVEKDIILSDVKVIKEKTQLELALNVSGESDDEWDKLGRLLKGKYAKRFMEEMENLSGREFMRMYPKMLEYFVPKVVRKDAPLGDGTDNVIRIQILQIDASGNKKVIDITDDIHNE